MWSVRFQNTSMVTLEEFIAETLIQIVRGSARAQTVLGKAAKINPPTVTTRRGALFNRHDGSVAQKPSTKHVSHTKHSVTFDVQVTASSGSQTKGDALRFSAVLPAWPVLQPWSPHEHAYVGRAP